jgi:hypothetical protein
MTDEELRRDIYGGGARSPAEQAAFNAGYAMGMKEGQRLGRNASRVNAFLRGLGSISALALVA